MFSIKHHKTKQFFFVLIKLSIVVGAFYFIYSKIAGDTNLGFNEFMAFLKGNEAFSPVNFIYLLVLSGFNWFFEILKWQNLVKTIKPISFNSALEQSLGALTASLITPNRIGDYGAKAMYYLKGVRTKIVLLNLLGNSAQMIITSVFGVIGLLLFVNRYPIEINYSKFWVFAAVFLIIVLLIVIGMKQKRFNIKGFSLIFIIEFIKSISLKSHATNLLFSLIRYLIFSFQFYYLLNLFGIDISYFEAMIVITSMYFLASIIPTISLFDVVIKGSIAVFLFNYLDVNELPVLAITMAMWLLNFVIPSLFGSYYVLNFKLPKPVEKC